MGRKSIVFIFSGVFLLFLLPEGKTQDERFYRGLFSGSVRKKEKDYRENEYKWIVESSQHFFDLNGDNIPEYFQVAKKDGEDWFIIRDFMKKIVFQYKPEKIGHSSFLYKLTLTNLSSKTKLVVLHFYEGTMDYINSYGQGRLYFLTIDNEDLENIHVLRGPAFWEETKKFPDHYHQRFFRLKTRDINKDGIKEVIVQFNYITGVYFYLGEGQWSKQ